MAKVTLDMTAFKALASDTRLSILRALDGKKLNLKELGKVTSLNKATLHEHLVKLNEAGLVKKKERNGHKWVYYKLTWRGEGLLHPENTRIVVLFSITFVSLLLAVVLMVNFLQPIPIGIAETVDGTTYLYEIEDEGVPLFQRSFSSNYIGDTDAREKTVGNITEEFQGRTKVRNSIGTNFDDEDIVWVENTKKGINQIDLKQEEKNILVCDESGSSVSPSPVSNPVSIDTVGFSLDHGAIPTSQVILYKNHEWDLSDYSINCTINETELAHEGEVNETDDKYKYYVAPDSDDNSTNESYMADGAETNERTLGFYPAVPSMIATVQDKTLLYTAVVCMIFFGVLFAISSWRFWVNRKPKL